MSSGDSKSKVVNVGLLDMQDPLLARLFAPGLTPWVLSPGNDLNLWVRQIKHIVGRMSEALDKPYEAFVEEVTLNENTLTTAYKALFDGNVFSKILREEENFTPSKLTK